MYLPYLLREFHARPGGGLDHTYKKGFNFRHLGFKISARGSVPVFFEFTESYWVTGIPDKSITKLTNEKKYHGSS